MNFSAFTVGFGLGVLSLAFIQTEEGQNTIRSIRKAIAEANKSAETSEHEEKDNGQNDERHGA